MKNAVPPSSLVARCLFLLLIVSFIAFPVRADSTKPLLVLNEIGFQSESRGFWIELHNPSSEIVRMDGWALRFLSGEKFTLPRGLPDCDPGCFLVLQFGHVTGSPVAGANSILIETPADFDPKQIGGGCVLLKDGTPVDAISWGRGIKSMDPALPMEAPLAPPVAVMEDSEEIYQPGDVCIRLPDTWPPHRQQWSGSGNWIYRRAPQASLGQPNPLPPPLLLLPVDGARLASQFYLNAVGLDWAAQVQFQVATDNGFHDIVLDQTLSGDSLKLPRLLPGDYYWRARGLGPGVGSWSPTHRVTMLGLDVDKMMQSIDGAGEEEEEAGAARPELPGGATLIERHVVGLNHLQQKKDTNMLCLDGCLEHGDFSWDRPHPNSSRVSEHAYLGCARAALAMIASQTCRLSQDRIAYYIFEESNGRSAADSGETGNPFGDLGHDLGTRGSDTVRALEWIYNTPPGSADYSSASEEIINDHDPSDMDSVRDYIADGRPVIRRIQPASGVGHQTVVDGYALVRYEDDSGDVREESLLRVLNPWNEGDIQWLSALAPGTTSPDFFFFPPRTGRPSRCDEPEVARDSDDDMIVDFDEIHRFGTDPNVPDSDNDWVRDDDDIRGYLFNLDGSYHRRDRDMDGDGLAKELDADNDRAENDGLIDGCEDVNLNGLFDPGGSETDNFVSNDDGNVLNPRCLSGYLRIGTAGAYQGVTIETHEEVSLNSMSTNTGDEYIYDHEWTTHGQISLPYATGSSTGSARTRARVSLELLDDGRYRLVTDTNQQQGRMTTNMTVLGRTTSSTDSIHFAFADIHYDYQSPQVPADFRAWQENVVGKPNIFEGEIETTPGGGRRLSGHDTVTLPARYSGGGTLQGSATRTWEVWLSTPSERSATHP